MPGMVSPLFESIDTREPRRRVRSVHARFDVFLLLNCHDAIPVTFLQQLFEPPKGRRIASDFSGRSGSPERLARCGNLPAHRRPNDRNANNNSSSARSATRPCPCGAIHLALRVRASAASSSANSTWLLPFTFRRNLHAALTSHLRPHELHTRTRPARTRVRERKPGVHQAAVSVSTSRADPVGQLVDALQHAASPAAAHNRRGLAGRLPGRV